MVIHDAPDLRRACPTNYMGRFMILKALCFVRFVYLVGNDDSAVLKYVNDYLQIFDFPPMQAAEKFYGLNWMDLP